MVEYARLALDRIARAFSWCWIISLSDASNLSTNILPTQGCDRRATTRKPTENRRNPRNPVQIATVGSPIEQNTLVLAGPAPGKPPWSCTVALSAAGRAGAARQILVLCFNHSAAVSLRKRLNALVGKDAGRAGFTYHGRDADRRISVRDMTRPTGIRRSTSEKSFSTP